jgi:hypothetical protein
MHPFPIFERYVANDIMMTSKNEKGERISKCVVKGNTQVVMFTSDFISSSFPWNIFGAGPRICAGMHLALPYLKVLQQKFAPFLTAHPDGKYTHVEFRPDLYHRYSGRNNDGKTDLGEIWYLLTLVSGIFYRAAKKQLIGGSSEGEDEELE